MAVNYVTFGSEHRKLVGNPGGRGSRSRSCGDEVCLQCDWKLELSSMCCVDVCEKVSDILEPLGFECYPFKVN